jgi:hypothetical protein
MLSLSGLLLLQSPPASHPIRRLVEHVVQVGVGVGGVELIQMQRYALKVAEEVGVRAVEVHQNCEWE